MKGREGLRVGKVWYRSMAGSIIVIDDSILSRNKKVTHLGHGVFVLRRRCVLFKRPDLLSQSSNGVFKSICLALQLVNFRVRRVQRGRGERIDFSLQAVDDDILLAKKCARLCKTRQGSVSRVCKVENLLAFSRERKGEIRNSRVSLRVVC